MIDYADCNIIRKHPVSYNYNSKENYRNRISDKLARYYYNDLITADKLTINIISFVHYSASPDMNRGEATFIQ